jgi:uncharacterized membrane protein
MTVHGRLRGHRWVLLVLGLAVVVGHAFVLRYASSRGALPTAGLAGIIVLLVISHRRLAGLFRTLWRRNSQE